jgi:hypothetical protein
LTRLRVHVQPGARTEGLVRWNGDALHLRVKAPAVAGRANAAVERLLAALLGVPASTVRVERGLTGRDKLVTVEGMTSEAVRAKLAAPEA